MIKKLIALIVIVAIAATVAYQMGWLSSKGEKAFDKTKEAVKEAIER